MIFLLAPLACAGQPEGQWAPGLQCLWSKELCVTATEDALPIASICKGTLVAATDGGRITALNLDGAKILWEKKAGRPPTSIKTAGNVAVVASGDKILQAYDLGSGAVRWKFLSPSRVTAYEVGVSRTLILTEGGTVHALDTAGGAEVWHKQRADWQHAQTALAKRTCFLLSSKGLLSALAENGSLKWEMHLSRAESIEMRTLAGDLVILAGRNALTAVDPGRGDVIWRKILDEPAELPSSQIGVILLEMPHSILDLRLVETRTGNRICRCSVPESMQRQGQTWATAIFGRVLIASPQPSGSLLAFNLKHKYLVRKVRLPSDHRLIGQDAGTLVFLSPKNVVSRVLVFPHALIEPRPRQILTGKGPLVATFVMLVSLAGLGLLLVFTVSPRIPPTHVSVVKQKVSKTILLIMAIAGIAALALIAKIAWAEAITAPRIIAGILSAVPAVSLCFGSSALRLRFSRVLKRAVSLNNDDKSGQNLLALVSKISAEMNLSHEPTVIVCDGRSGTLLVAETRRNEPVVVLPDNAESRALKACQENSKQANSLLRFVIAHELSHIKTGDYRLKALRSVLRGAVGITVIGLWSVVALAGWAGLDPPLAVVVQPFASYVTLGGILLCLILRSCCRDRERLADAAASLYVSPKTLSEITSSYPESKSETSPLERFVVGLSVPSILASHFAGVSPRLAGLGNKIRRGVSQLWPSAISSLRSFRRRIQTRAHSIVSKRHAVSQALLPSPGIILVTAAVAGITFQAFRLLFLDAFMWCWLSYDPSSFTDPGVSISAATFWTQLAYETPVHGTYEAVSASITSILIVTFGMWRFRDAPSMVGGVSSRSLLGLAVGFAVTLVASAGVADFLNGACGAAFPTFPTMRISFSGVFPMTILAALATFLFIAARSYVPVHGTRSFAAGCIVRLPMCLLLPFAALVPLNKVLPLSAAFLLLLNAMVFVGSLNAFGILRFLESDIREKTEWLEYHRVLWFRNVRTWWRSGPPPPLGLTSVRHAAGAILTFLLPVGAVVLVALPHLVELDRWYFTHLGEIRESLNRFFFDTPPEDVGQLPKTTVAWTFCVWLFEQEARPDGLFPSTLVGFLFMFLQFVVMVVGFGVVALASPGRRASKRAMWTTFLFGLSRCLDLPSVEAVVRRSLRKLLQRRQGSQGPIIGESGLPLTRATCETLEQCHGLDEQRGSPSRMVEWVKRCECSGGGFAALPGASPDILHTAHAVRVLAILNCLNESRQARHWKWLRTELDCHLEQKERFSDLVWLEDVYYLTRGMKSLSESLDKKKQDAVSAEALNRTAQGSDSPEVAFYLVQILWCCGTLHEKVSQVISEAWMTKQAKRLRALDPAKELQKAYWIVMIARLVYPESYRSLPGIEQFKDNLSKRFERNEPWLRLKRIFSTAWQLRKSG